VPSSERSAASGASPLKPNVEPLLRDALAKVSAIIDDIIPQKKPTTALEEAMYDDRNDEFGFEKENLQREFESSRINRPRLLISGLEGMGQQYISAALLAKFEGLHVQSFDMSTLLKDSTRVSLCHPRCSDQANFLHSPPKQLLFNCSRKSNATSLVSSISPALTSGTRQWDSRLSRPSMVS
jgi:hypothetical protein